MNKKALSESDICDRFITPALERSGWSSEQWRREFGFTDGKMIVRGKLVARGKPRRADYLLFHRPNIPIAVIEAKDNKHSVRAGMQQGLDYAERLDVPFVFSSNGDGFVLHDKTGTYPATEMNLTLDEFPTRAELWRRYKIWRGIEDAVEPLVTSPNHSEIGGKTPRYYQQLAINRTIEAVAKGQDRLLLAMATGTGQAARDLLMRRPPRAGQGDGNALRGEDEDAQDAARRLVRQLDASYLAIQGPPGSGKSSVGAEMIVDLVAAGRKVGVTANSHKVIGELLEKVADEAARRSVAVRIGQRASKDGPAFADAAHLKTNDAAHDALVDDAIDVVGGTSWLWAREDMAGSADTLFIDEAGQMSLADALAASLSARNLVLLGDPQQLDQPLQGTHPPGAERSALAHLLDGEATMPAELGLFLEGTWRLHPDITAYTSEVFYEGRLHSHPGRELQRIEGPGIWPGSGIRFIPVEHAGNDSSSVEEAEAVAEAVRELLAADATWTDDNGATLPLTLEDILIITPYNAQVHEITERLPGARVGTVDKFQGQQAPISIYSMATSSAEEAPRGMEFLYSLNRLNVATSRARCLTAVFASADLVRAHCRTPRQMRLANALARLIEVAAGR